MTRLLRHFLSPFGLALVLALAALTAASPALAGGQRGLGKTTYKTPKSAALRMGANNLNHSPKVRNKLGTITSRRLRYDGKVGQSKTGVVQYHSVSTRKGNGAGQPAATTVVHVRTMADGTFRAYRDSKGTLNPATTATQRTRAVGSEGRSYTPAPSYRYTGGEGRTYSSRPSYSPRPTGGE